MLIGTFCMIFVYCLFFVWCLFCLLFVNLCHMSTARLGSDLLHKQRDLYQIRKQHAVSKQTIMSFL
jgi:hypothetical protein